MTEKFDVKLEGKTFLPDPSLKENVRMGDYELAYNEFTRDP